VADVNRANSLLDEAFDPKPGKKSRRKRKEGLSKDQVRRLAFRVLASISQYDGPARERILRQALSVNEA
jgi:hypothetical protein